MTTSSEEELFPNSVEFVLKALYTFIATAGLLSNGAIVYIFITKKLKMNSFKVFLLNLTISDGLAAASIWPYIFIDLKSLQGMANTRLMCAITVGNVMYWFATVTSIFSLTLMSINRYIAICHPKLTLHFNQRCATRLFLCLVWPSGILISAPNIFTLKYLPKYAICIRDWPSGFNSTVFGILTFFLGFIFPVSTIAFTSIATKKYFWSRRFGSVSRSSQTIRRNRKAAMLMGLLVAAFFACWSPFFVYWILSSVVPSAFPQGIAGEYTTTRALRVVILISLINTVTNPIIYGLRGDTEFKIAFKKLKHFVCCCTQQENGGDTERPEKITKQTSSV